MGCTILRNSSHRLSESDAKAMQSTEILTLESVHIPRFQAAYEEVLPFVTSLPEPNCLPIEVVIPTLVARVLNLWPKICAEKKRLEQEQTAFNLREFDRVKVYALALGHSHGLYVSASERLADCLAIPEQARRLYHDLVEFADEPAPAMEPLTALALAHAIAQRLPVENNPILTCRARTLVDKLEGFSVQCENLQDELFLATHHRNVLLGLLVNTYDRIREFVENLPYDSKILNPFPSLVETPTFPR
jgi:hypothetical protein